MEEDSLPEGGRHGTEPHTVCPLEDLRRSQREQEGLASSLGEGEGWGFPDVCSCSVVCVSCYRDTDPADTITIPSLWRKQLKLWRWYPGPEITQHMAGVGD